MRAYGHRDPRGHFDDVFGHPGQVRMCGDGEVLALVVVEDCS